jgi:hypothetical protein
MRRHLESLTMKLKDRIETWYQGKYIPPPENVPDSPFIVLSPGHYEKSTGAKIAEFHLKHWTVLLTVYVTIIFAIFAALVSLFIYLDPLQKSSKTRNEDTQEEQRNPNGKSHKEPPNKPKVIDNFKI